MLVYYFVPFIVSNRYLLFWVSNGHNSVTVQNRTHVNMNFFHHKDLRNHLLQLCPKVVKHPVELQSSIQPLSPHLHPPVPFRSNKFIHVVCLTKSTASKLVLHKVRASSSSFNLQHRLLPLKSSSSCLRLLRLLPVTSILPDSFNSVF